jgi:phosphoribosyl-AMP cyclohydrolase
MDLVNKQLEEGEKLTLDFSKIAKVVKSCKDVIPVAVQDIETMEVILIAYTNQKAFEHTLQTRTATFWSTSRNELWIKGKGSGNTFAVKNILVNCEQNSLVYMVKGKAEGICHTYNKSGKSRNCFYRKLNMKNLILENIDP